MNFSEASVITHMCHSCNKRHEYPMKLLPIKLFLSEPIEDGFSKRFHHQNFQDWNFTQFIETYSGEGWKEAISQILTHWG